MLASASIMVFTIALAGADRGTVELADVPRLAGRTPNSL
jgi:hypothetical protein